MRNILITGGGGYIGSHTAKTLEENGYCATIFDNFSNSDKSIIKNLGKLTNNKINWVEGDVLNVALIEKTLKDYKIDAVIHFAGLKSVVDSEKNPINYYQNNVCGAISLLSAMKNTQVKKLVFSSSATVYGIPEYLPYDENHPTNPINTYGRTKLQIERALQDVANSDKDWGIIILRYFNPIGAHESGLIGDNPVGKPNNLIPCLVRVARGDFPVLKIYGNDYTTRDGTGIRDYIHVIDLAEGHLSSLEYLNNLSGIETFNLGSGVGVSVLELINVFEKVTGKSVKYEFFPRRKGDLKEYYANPSLANKILRWKTKRNINDMLYSSWKYYLNHN